MLFQCELGFRACARAFSHWGEPSTSFAEKPCTGTNRARCYQPRPLAAAMPRRSDEQLVLAAAAEHTRPQWYDGRPDPDWHMAQEKWVASWGGPAIELNAIRRIWWPSRKRAFSAMLSDAKLHLATWAPERLASTLAAARLRLSDHAAGDGAQALCIRKRLRPSGEWVAKHAPRLVRLDAPTPVPSPEGRHATRTIQAGVLTPCGGRARFEEIDVNPRPLTLALAPTPSLAPNSDTRARPGALHFPTP